MNNVHETTGDMKHTSHWQSSEEYKKEYPRMQVFLLKDKKNFKRES